MKRRIVFFPAAWLLRLAAFAALALGAVGAFAADTSAADQLQRWSAQAGVAGSPAQGRVIFQSRHGAEWSCASCHGTPPTAQGKHANTGKTIAPLAPAFNAEAFTDVAKTDKWFRRNCKDVLSRECSAREKADVLAYLLSLTP
jgi:cytochrome c553